MITLIMFLTSAQAVPQSAGAEVEGSSPTSPREPEAELTKAECWWCWIFVPGLDMNPDRGRPWRPRQRYAITQWTGGCVDEYCWWAEEQPTAQPVPAEAPRKGPP